MKHVVAITRRKTISDGKCQSIKNDSLIKYLTIGDVLSGDSNPGLQIDPLAH